MEAQRLFSVLDQHLAQRTYLVGEEYTIADIVVFPWFNAARTGYQHPSGVGAAEFLSIDEYTHAIAWADRIKARPAVVRGVQVCTGGVGKPWLQPPPSTSSEDQK